MVALLTATRTEFSKAASSFREVVEGRVPIMSSCSVLVKTELTRGVGFVFLVVWGFLVYGEAAAAAYNCPSFLVGGDGGGGGGVGGVAFLRAATAEMSLSSLSACQVMVVMAVLRSSLVGLIWVIMTIHGSFRSST